jgi:Exportin-T
MPDSSSSLVDSQVYDEIARQVASWVTQSAQPGPLQYAATRQLQDWQRSIVISSSSSTSTNSPTSLLQDSIHGPAQDKRSSHAVTIGTYWNVLCRLLVATSQPDSLLTSIDRDTITLYAFTQLSLSVPYIAANQKSLLREWLLLQSASAVAQSSTQRPLQAQSGYLSCIYDQPAYVRNKCAYLWTRFIFCDGVGMDLNSMASIPMNSNVGNHDESQVETWSTWGSDMLIRLSSPHLFLSIMQTLWEDYSVMADGSNLDNGNNSSSGGVSNMIDLQDEPMQHLKRWHVPSHRLRSIKQYLKVAPAVADFQVNLGSTTMLDASPTTLLQQLFVRTTLHLVQALQEDTQSAIEVTVLSLRAMQGFLSLFDSSHIGTEAVLFVLNVISTRCWTHSSFAVQTQAWKVCHEWLLSLATLQSKDQSMTSEQLDGNQWACIQVMVAFLSQSTLLSSQGSGSAVNGSESRRNSSSSLPLVIDIDTSGYSNDDGSSKSSVVYQLAQCLTVLGCHVLLPVWRQYDQDHQQNQPSQQQQQQSISNDQLTAVSQHVVTLVEQVFQYPSLEISSAIIPLLRQWIASVEASSVCAGLIRPRFATYLQIMTSQWLLSVLQSDSGSDDAQYDDGDENENDMDSNSEKNEYRDLLLQLYQSVVRFDAEMIVAWLSYMSESLFTDMQTLIKTMDGKESSRHERSMAVRREQQKAVYVLQMMYCFTEGVRLSSGAKQASSYAGFTATLTRWHQFVATLLSPSLSATCQALLSSEVLSWYWDIAIRYHYVYTTHTIQKAASASVASSAPSTPDTGAAQKQSQVESDSLLLLSSVYQSLWYGVSHPRASIRTPATRQLLRWVQTVLAYLQPLAHMIILNIGQWCMSMSSPSAQSLTEQGSWRLDSWCSLMEALGLLIGQTNLDVSQQKESLRQILQQQYNDAVSTLQVIETQGSATVELEAQLSRSLAGMAHLSKGFTKRGKCHEEIQRVWVDTMPLALRMLQAMPYSESIRNKTMVYLQSMIACIQGHILPFMSQFLVVLVECCTVEDFSSVSQLFIQLCIKFKEGSVSAIDVPLLPFLRKCQQLVPFAETNTKILPHLQAEQLGVQKLAYGVLQHVVSQGATPALFTANNLPSLETILQTMLYGATSSNDPVVQKTCLKFFRDLLVYSSSLSNTIQRGLHDFCVHQLIPCVLDATLADPTFNEADAGCARVISEFASVFFFFLHPDISLAEREKVMAVVQATQRHVPFDAWMSIKQCVTASQLDKLLHIIYKTYVCGVGGKQ